MFDKYEIKTYPEYTQFDDSDTESDLKKTTASSKKITYINPKRISLNQTECIFTNDNNISFYQSDSKSSYKERKYKSLNRNLKNRNDEFNLLKKKKDLIFQPYFVEEQFSYNYTSTEDNNENNTNNNTNNTPLTQRILLDNYLRKSSHQVPKRTIKTYQNQFDVEKSDNFNVLSYKQPEYESDIPKKEGKSKIIQIFKKEEAGELFFPSKRVQSPQSPSSSNNSSGKKTKLFSYQTPTLKFQSFFGSYTRAKNPKISQAKSTSKRKTNQLEDFNIDKLIEIGDNHSNNLKHILSFGKKINKIKNKNKNKINLNYNTNKDLSFNHLDIEEKSEIEKKEDNLMDIVQISPKKIENQEINNNNNSNIISDNNNMTKKIVYHGQIKRKRNIKNAKDFMNSNKVIPNENQIQGNININRNINSAKEVLSNDNSINSNNNNNNNNPNSIKFKILSANRKPKDNENLFNKAKSNSICHQITPKKTLQKKKIEINLKDKLKYSINYDNLYNILQKNNKYINNYTKMNLGNSLGLRNKTLNDIPKKTLLTEDNEKDNKNYVQKVKPCLKKAIINEGENPIKRFNKNQTNSHIYISKANNNNNNNSNNANNQVSKKISDKIFKTKNYYGYDERHNLEGPINNHSYYVSVYSKKNINQKNLSTDKIN